MTKDITKLTLGELLSSKDEVIANHANGIVKALRNEPDDCEHDFIPADNEGIYGFSWCRWCGKREHN